jgi:hypothetical protein
MKPPNCPNCGEMITRALDAPYGYWEWGTDGYVLRTASRRVDVAPWLHWNCMGELRDFHPQYHSPTRA